MPSSSATSGARGTMSRAVEHLACLRFAARKTTHASCSISSPTLTPEQPLPPRHFTTIRGISTAGTWLFSACRVLPGALWVSGRLLRGHLRAGRLYLRYALSQGGVGLGELRDDRVRPPSSFLFLAQNRAKVADLIAQILDLPPHLEDAQGVVSDCFQKALTPETLQAIVHTAGR